MQGGREKLVFANQLRGLAALAVMLSHLGGVLILMSPTVGWIISAPQLSLGTPFILHLTRLSWLNFGPLGVAVFFLISGFVIPFSLEKNSWGGFLVARIFRIFPTYWVALLLEFLAVFVQSKFYGRPMAFPPRIYFYNAALADTILGNGYVDLVNWTLAIEVKFYILIAAIWPLVRLGSVFPFICWSLFAIIVATAQQHGMIHLTDQFADEPMCIGFMLIGTVFYFRMTARISLIRSVFAVLTLLALFTICWRVGPIQNQFPIVTANYFYALVIFASAYGLRRYFRPLRMLDFLADISFPFYLIHSIIGYSLITFMVGRRGMTYTEALPIAVGIVLCLAWVIHVAVENPTQNLGKRLANVIASGRRRVGAAGLDHTASKHAGSTPANPRAIP